MKNVQILKGEIFRRQYMVYIIELIYRNKYHYYIGHTGDFKDVTPRSAIYMFSRNLVDQGQSTQNHLYRYVVGSILTIPDAYKCKDFIDEIKAKVEGVLVNSVVKMHTYKLQDFQPWVKRIEHLEIVRKVILFKKFVMTVFREESRSLINRKRSGFDVRVECPYPNILEEIKKDFGLKD